MKSANTIIATTSAIKSDTKEKIEFFYISDGNPSLSKAGSGDILTGLIASLLAQNYDAKNACITASEVHALCSCINKNGENYAGNEFNLTSEKIIENLSTFCK